MAYIFGSIWDRFNRNALNTLSKSVEQQGVSIQDLVAKGQLTPTQYATLIQAVNGLISKGDVTFDDIDINKGKLLPRHMSEELLKMITGDAPINAVPADGSITENKLAKKSVTLTKIDLPVDILPKYFNFNLLNTARFLSDPLFLNAGDKIVSTDEEIVFSTWYEYVSGGTTVPAYDSGWTTEFIAKESRVHYILARKTDSSTITGQQEYFTSKIYVEHDDMAMSKSQFDEQLNISQSVPSVFVRGNINGTDGTLQNTSARYASVVHIELEKGDTISLTKSNEYDMAVWVEYGELFINGWNTINYTAPQNTLASFMIRKKNGNDISLEEAPTVVETRNANAFAKMIDIEKISGVSGSIKVTNTTELKSAIKPNATIEIGESFNLTESVSINVNLYIKGNGYKLSGAGVTGILIAVSDGLVVFDNLEVTNGDTNIIRTTGGEVTIVDSKMLHSNDSVTYFGGTSVVKLIRSEFAYSKSNDGIAPKDNAKVYIYDCSAHDNFDEGISTHDSCYTEVYGGNYYNNGYVVGTAETTKVRGASSSFGGVHIGGGLMGTVKNANAYNNRTYGISFINFMDTTLNDKEVVSGNTVYDNGDFGMYFTAARDIMMSGNLIVRNGKGIGFGKEPGYATEVASKGYVTNNTIIDNIGVAVQVGDEQAEQYDVLFAGNTIVENGDDNIIVPSNFGGRVLQ